jgi:hypothetical protein
MQKVAGFFTKNLIYLAEMGLILVWALWIGQVYLNANPYELPGRDNDDFLLSIYPYYPLQQLLTCGDCILWNGLLNGGSPTLGDSIGGPLHPVLFTLIVGFGVHNGIKYALLAALIIAGWGQWWTGKVLNLGMAARMWMGLFAVVAGNLAGPNAEGDVGIVFSVAATSLVIAPGIQLSLSGRRRDAIILAIMIAQALLSGQGYLQLGLALCLIPALIVFVINRKDLASLRRKYILAVGLGIGLAAIVILPIIVFAPQISSPLEPQTRQPMEYIPVNWVVRDTQFFDEPSLGKVSGINVYSNYIGWGPILLALIAWRLAQKDKQHIFYFFVVAIILSLFLASGITLDFVRTGLPNISLGTRTPGFVAGLTISLIIGLSGWGLQLLLAQKWPILYILAKDSKKTLFEVSSAVVLIPALVWSIYSVSQFNSQFRYLAAWPERYALAAELFSKQETGWVQPPYGNWPVAAALVNQNVKVNTYRIWDYKSREYPKYQFDISEDPSTGSNANIVASFDGFFLIRNPNSYYAAINMGEEEVPCKAKSNGGHISIDCIAEKPGKLVVLENHLPGWSARLDGKRAKIFPGQWLSIELPKGEHNIQFRYMPPDFILGALISLASIAACIWLWFSSEIHSSQPSKLAQQEEKV